MSRLGYPRMRRGILGITALIAVWQTLSSTGLVNPLLLPSPLALVETLWRMARDGSMFANALASLERVLVGFLIAAVVGIALGVALGWWRALSDVVRPVVDVFRPIPPIA